MTDTEKTLCEFCEVGYHAPFERFEKIAVIPDGPAFLMKCKSCGALWHETLRSAQRIPESEAQVLFHDFEL